MRQDGVEVGLPLMVGSPAPRDAGDRPGGFGVGIHLASHGYYGGVINSTVGKLVRNLLTSRVNMGHFSTAACAPI